MNNLYKRLVKLCFLFIGIFLLTACPEYEYEEEFSSNVRELKVGNSWTYSETYYSENEAINKIDTITYDIVKDTNIAYIIYYIFEINKVRDDKFYKNFYNGHYFNYISAFEGNDILEYKLPCEVNDTWNIILNNTITNVIVKSKDVLVSCELGDYFCIEYQFLQEIKNEHNETTLHKEISYVCPGYGIIKSIASTKSDKEEDYSIYKIKELISTNVRN